MTTLISFLGKGRLDPQTGYRQTTYRFAADFARLLADDGIEQGSTERLASATHFERRADQRAASLL